jgi:hypothetical protein
VTSFRRRSRERKALAYLSVRGAPVSPLDLGTAAVAGEPPLHPKARAVIGMELGVHFVKRGFARATRFNQFEPIPQ